VRHEVDSYKGWQRILPNTEFEGYDIFYKAKQLFDKLAGKKGIGMSSSKFCKLAKISGLSNESMQQVHYEILFRKIVSQAENKQMTLEIFFNALESLAEILYPLEIDKFEALIHKVTAAM